MFTRCPQCQTAYRIHAEQLMAASGLVRCGKCANVFQSLDFLFDIPHPPYPALQVAQPAPKPEQGGPQADASEFFDRSLWEPYTPGDPTGHAAFTTPAREEPAAADTRHEIPPAALLAQLAQATWAGMTAAQERQATPEPEIIEQPAAPEPVVTPGTAEAQAAPAAEIIEYPQVEETNAAQTEPAPGTAAETQSTPEAVIIEFPPLAMAETEPAPATAGEMESAPEAEIIEYPPLAAPEPEAPAIPPQEPAFEPIPDRESGSLAAAASWWPETSGAAVASEAETQPQIEAVAATAAIWAEEPAPPEHPAVEEAAIGGESDFFRKTPEQAETIFTRVPEEAPAHDWLHVEPPAPVEEPIAADEAPPAETSVAVAEVMPPEALERQLHDIEAITSRDDGIDAYLAGTADGAESPPQPAAGETIALAESPGTERLDGFEPASALTSDTPVQTAAETEIAPPQAAPGRKGGRTGLWAGGGLLLIVLLFGQLVYFNRNELARHDALRPALEGMCDLLGCRIPLREDVTAFEIVDRDIRSNPRNPAQLAIDTIFVSNARFTQPFPLVHLTFNSIQGETIKSFTFTPEQYLSKNIDIQNGMAPGTRIHLKTTIPDPGPEAVNYFLDFSHRPR